MCFFLLFPWHSRENDREHVQESVHAEGLKYACRILRNYGTLQFLCVCVCIFVFLLLLFKLICNSLLFSEQLQWTSTNLNDIFLFVFAQFVCYVFFSSRIIAQFKSAQNIYYYNIKEKFLNVFFAVLFLFITIPIQMTEYIYRLSHIFSIYSQSE